MAVDSLAYRRRAGLVYPRKKPPYNPLLRPIAGHPLADGLVGCWLLNAAGGGTVYDLSGNGNHGTINGATWGPGRDGPALHFDGIDDYVDCGDTTSISSITGDMTIAAWIKADTFVSYEALIAKGGIISGFTIQYADASGTLKLWWFSTGWKGAATTVTAGVWTHIVGVHAGTELVIYKDGVKGTPNSDVGPMASNTGYNLFIGKHKTLSYYIDGLIDDVRIYNRALSAQEIWQLYTDPYCMLAVQETAWLYYEAAAGLSIPIAMHHYRGLRG